MTAKIPAFLLMLHDQKYLTEDEYTLILKNFKTSKDELIEVLLKVDLLNEDEIIPLIAEELKAPYVQLTKIHFDSHLPDFISPKVAYHYFFIPLKINDDLVEIAFSNLFDLEVMDEIQTVIGKNIKPVLAGRKDIRNALKRFYGIGADTVQEMINQVDTPSEELVLKVDSDIENLSEDASIIKFVNQVIGEATKERATDIHIEPYEDELKIRYRIDGVLYDAPFPTLIKHFHSPILSRLKIMSNLNISERRKPQDGRMKVRLQNKDLDLRLSILPTPWGEAASIRILSGSTEFFVLKDLGLDTFELNQINQSITKPHGMFLVTGPTGSGKTTTLYACLNRLNTRDRKIITIEDPIEYQIKNITQLQINPAIHFTFATGLRSMLRHDPDIMMVGEIRDYETAEIAVQAALTGHLVFSTLHTNDSANTITRLTDIGVEHFLLASSLQCILAQRLIRVLCNECKKLEHIHEEIKNTIKDLPHDLTENYVSRGCHRCNYTGFFGRIGIFEILIMDETLRDYIQRRFSSEKIRNYASQKGTISLRANGYQKVKQSITSLEEVLRVTADNI